MFQRWENNLNRYAMSESITCQIFLLNLKKESLGTNQKQHIRYGD